VLDVKSLEGVAAPGGAWLLEAAGSSNFCLLRLLLRWNPRGIVYSKGGFVVAVKLTMKAWCFELSGCGSGGLGGAQPLCWWGSCSWLLRPSCALFHVPYRTGGDGMGDWGMDATDWRWETGRKAGDNNSSTSSQLAPAIGALGVVHSWIGAPTGRGGLGL